MGANKIHCVLLVSLMEHQLTLYSATAQVSQSSPERHSATEERLQSSFLVGINLSRKDSCGRLRKTVKTAHWKQTADPLGTKGYFARAVAVSLQGDSRT